jgi:hypothetical protein
LQSFMIWVVVRSVLEKLLEKELISSDALNGFD